MAACAGRPGTDRPAGIREMGRGKLATPGVRVRTAQSIEIDFYYRGVRCRERLKLAPNTANRRYASRLKAEIEGRIARDEFNYAEFFPDSPRARTLSRRAGDAITVGEVLRRYIDTAERSLQRSTWLDYNRSVDSHLIPTFGDLHLTELTRAKLREWASGLDVTPKRLANILLPLRAVLKDAAADEIIDRNVLHGWKPEIKAKLRDETAIDPFTPDEIRLICAACDGQLRNLVQFGFWTGVRTSELFALRWPDVDWRRGLVRVQRARVRGETKTTKTAAGVRDVKLLPPALEALKAQRTHTELLGGEIFHDPRTDAPWSGDHALRSGPWRRALRAAGVRYRYPYQMRHTYASMMLSAGENPAWIARQMGHADWGMIRRTYARWMPDVEPNAGDKASSWCAKNAAQK